MKLFSLIVLTLTVICGVAGYPKSCPQKCPMAYNPVCGLNGFCYQIFRNSCFMEAKNCDGEGVFHKVQLSECLRVDASKCELESTLNRCPSPMKFLDFFLTPNI